MTLPRHYRHGIDECVLETIAGGMEGGEAPEVAIRRELEEEIGLRNATIHPVGMCYANPANQTNKMYGFVAIGGTFDGKKQAELGADFQIVTMPLEALYRVIEDQTEIMQSLHLATIFLAAPFLKRHSLGS